MNAGDAANEIWILGGTGRSGAAIGQLLAEAGYPTVLLGRDRSRLATAAERAGAGVMTRVVGSVEGMIHELRSAKPAVVVNTIGPFAGGAVQVAKACLPCSHYLDLANDAFAAAELLALNSQAMEAGRTLITGAGFGVVATESVVIALCQGRPAARRVRVDAFPSVATEEGIIGQALAATIVDGLPAGGRRYEGGQLVKIPIAADVEQVRLPDGAWVSTAGVPSGEVLAAQRASGADFVVSASSEVPSGRMARMAIPLAATVLSAPAVARFATRRLAKVGTKPAPRPREHSWARARVEWSDGTTRQGWLRAGDAGEFTAASAAAVAGRLATGHGLRGAHTPIAALGGDLAIQAGGELLLDD